jgi:hypothetical protein
MSLPRGGEWRLPAGDILLLLQRIVLFERLLIEAGQGAVIVMARIVTRSSGRVMRFTPRQQLRPTQTGQ